MTVRGAVIRAITPRRVALAFVITPFTLVWLGVGHAGDPPTELLIGAAPAADSGSVPTAPSDPATPTIGLTPSASSPDRSGTPTPGTGSPSGSPSGTASTPARPTRPPTRPPRDDGSATVPKGVTKAAEELTDVAYARGSDAQTLDLYLPDRTGRAVPLVIDIHGGAFMGGSKSDNRGRIDALRERGYAVASVNYRLSSEAPFPAGVRDVKAATRWLRANAADYGIDPRRFAAWGDSAGGYFAAALGTTSGRTTTFDDASLGNAGVSSAVQAVVDFYGPIDFLTMDRQASNPGGCPQSPQVHDDAGSPESLWLGSPVQSVPSAARSASPLTYLRPGAPPFFVAHGKADCNVPHGQSLQLVAALKAERVPVTFHLLDDAGHGDPAFDDRLRPQVIDFLDRALHRA